MYRQLFFLFCFFLNFQIHNGQAPATTSQTSADRKNVSNENQDLKEIRILIRVVLNWADSKQTIDLLPSKQDPKDANRLIFDLVKHKENLNALKSTGFFASEFIQNYDRIILSYDKRVTSKKVDWVKGYLPAFGNDANPWCDCQDVPYDNPNPWDQIEIKKIRLTSDTGDFYWKWGKTEVNTAPGWKEFVYRFRVVKESGTWKISFMQQFDPKKVD
jgi:hypothetical protein